MKNPPLLHAEIRGTGPTVVLLHGFLSSSHYWQKVTELVESNHRVIAIDLLGFGNSPKPRNNTYDYGDHIASINATLKHHDVNDEFVLIGHSMGALIALRYSIMYEERVRKLILTNMPILFGQSDIRQTILKTGIMHRLGLMPSTHRFAWALFRGLVKLRFLSRGAREMVERHKHYLFAHNAESRMRSFQRIIRDARVDLDLNVVRVKTVLLSGLEDRKLYLQNLMQYVDLSPNVAVENFDTGHHIPLVMPELIARRLRD